MNHASALAETAFILPHFVPVTENVVSIPLNCALNTEGDYIGALQHLVIPIALEYQPDLVLVALGLDSAYYDDLLEHGQAIKAHGFLFFLFS
ncbi:unnamed protein product [Gongylonema pulchrum]|uniref:Arginase n=1 Tax=Gongylonema pulchrum TaxID=637853 RepID=A0A183DK10_9BILA|nr:unnamed protein product [Gongylonema pulchrum]